MSGVPAIGRISRRIQDEARHGGRPRMLVLSGVLPFPGAAGQQQRVRYTLEAARDSFHVTFATYAPARTINAVREELSGYCDEAVVLPSLYSRTRRDRWVHRVRGAAVALKTGVKRTNYEVGHVEFSPSRIRASFEDLPFDVVLFEYWYAARTTQVFREKGIPCVLDMHNVLWRAYERQILRHRALPLWARRWATDRYRRREEEAWRMFDGIVAINREEDAEVRKALQGSAPRVFFAPMGVDLSRWPCRWRPAHPVRIGFYGGLGSSENVEGALRTRREVMPRVWERFPEAELWLVGGGPSQALLDLARDPRVHVTGFVPDAAETLGSMTCVVCPWSGKYGFRSRLVEVMSVGVPVIASRDAVSGMDLEAGKEILLADDDAGLARLVLSVLEDPAAATAQSRRARARVEELFSVERTYGRWMSDMADWLRQRGGEARAPGRLLT